MKTIIKNSTIKKGFGPGILNNQIKGHDNDPFVIKKVEEATKTIQKVGLPESKKRN